MTATAQPVRTARQIVRGDQQQYPDRETIDYVYWLVSDYRGALTASKVAAAVKISTHEARGYLQRLVNDELITAAGNGAWTRYTSNGDN